MSSWIVEGGAVDDREMVHLIVDVDNTGDWRSRCTGRPASREPVPGRARCLRCALKAAEAFRLGEQPLHAVKEWMRVDRTAFPSQTVTPMPVPQRRSRSTTAIEPDDSENSELVLDLTDPDLRFVMTDALSRWAAHQRRKARAEPDATLIETRNRWADLADEVRIRAETA
ncbi:hypothetical protein [Nocardia inohanensis]|uniref:hypothetical protein n=1 Tax=Nocardia inohanensis TaxID=209246 RepID=UPI0008341286|nr:hypothetical protein [Nocardia inohanensis]